MIMAPVSSHTTTPVGDEPTDNIPFRKRASIHYPEGSSSAKRMSLSFGPRARSHSESWALTPTTIVPAKEKEASLLPASTTTPALSSLSSSSPSKAETMDMDGPKENSPKEQVDPELMKTLASFLKGHQESATASETSKHTKDAIVGETKEDCDLVITVRDFAYPKTHPCHFGQYPPEPEYEESDIEEEEEVEEDEEEDDYAHEDNDENRTQGQARGLYDFDAENESELSFREGDMVWIHCRQFPGWFLGEMGCATGLVPENYVQFV
ncbi:MAG: hypothetical protein BYD32DRAFT_154332 [Podila humilis]|nr:MAG: hypothetical protein BYD32DRAFT_154332 [Podila humilis]